MSGTLVIRDDADWMPAGWVFDNILELVATELQTYNPSLSEALLKARTGVGMGYLDIRSLEADQFRTLIGAVNSAYNHVIQEGAEAFHDPLFYEGLVKRFGDLKLLLQTDARAEKDSPD